MNIRGWHCYIVFNCAFIIPCLLGKSVSLNALIAAENHKNKEESMLKPQSKGLVGTPVSLNAIIAAENQKKHALDSTSDPKTKEESPKYHFSSDEENIRNNKFISKETKAKATQLVKKASSLKNKRSDYNPVKSRLKPQDILNKLRRKRKSKSKKRETIHDENSDSNYVPILRNLGKLFDKILHNDASTTSKLRKGKHKHNKIITERNGMVCTCQKKTSFERTSAFIKSPKKATAYATSLSAEVSADTETAPETTTDTALANIRSVGPNKDVSLLLPRNSLSSWRNHNGHSKRSSSSFHGNVKRNITRHHGNGKHNSRVRVSNTESYEENTNSFTRNISRSDEFGGGNGNITRSQINRKETDEDTILEKNKNNTYRPSEDMERQNQLQIRRNETGNETSVSEYGGRPRGDVSEDQVSANTEPVQSKENHEKSVDDVTLDRADDQRIFDGSGPVTTETEDVSTENIAMISIKDLSNLTLALQSAPKGDLPIVTIFGGYSVAKDINGQNKLSEQSIHIHS